MNWKNMLQKLDVIGHVHLLGLQRDPLPYYACATVYLRTAIFEGENLSSYQAMAIGLPVVGFDTGCGNELIKKVGYGILVPNRDREALTRAVQKILNLQTEGKKWEDGVRVSSSEVGHTASHRGIHQCIRCSERTPRDQ